jgi:hypothetical protein
LHKRRREITGGAGECKPEVGNVLFGATLLIFVLVLVLVLVLETTEDREDEDENEDDSRARTVPVRSASPNTEPGKLTSVLSTAAAANRDGFAIRHWGEAANQLTAVTCAVLGELPRNSFTS